MKNVGKEVRGNLVQLSIGLFFVAVALLSGCAKNMPMDNAQLKDLEFDNLMGTRYTEVLLVFGSPLKKEFTAGIYNTVGLNGANSANGGDSSPAEILDKIDFEKVEKDNDALSTVLNGPRFWTIDNLGVKVGKERDFQGLKAHWVMWFPIPDAIREGKDLSYAVMDAKRDTSMGINKGSRVYLLDDPEGNTWCMKSASLIKEPDQKLSDLKDLGSRLNTPQGWTFRTLILEKDLVFMTDNGNTYITQDEIGNTYDRVGGNYSNYKP